MIDQSAFVNVSIFDRNYTEALFGGVEFPDGSFMIDNVEEFIEHQKVFMEVVSQIRSENMFTFPVLTYSLLYKDDKFIDEGFARWCSDHNVDWNDSNFFISGDVTTLSNCCFSGEQMVLAKSSSYGVIHTTIKELYDLSYNYKKNFTVFHNGSWVKSKVIKLPARDMYRVVTANGKEMILTDNHINPTLDGDKQTSELTTDDYLMFNTAVLHPYKEKDQHLTYEQGFLIGMYLGDGSRYKSKECDSVTVNLSINQKKFEKSEDALTKALSDLGETEYGFSLATPYNNVYPVATRSKKVYSFIKNWVRGKKANDKELNMDCLLQSVEFRTGIIDGYYLTDGGNSNRIYSTSKNLIYQIEAVLTSLGRNSVIDITDRTDEDVVIRGEIFKRNFPLYCIRWYNSGNRRVEKDVFIRKNNSVFFKIKSIERVSYDDPNVYCFEVDEKYEPYFTLPNGIITHNCRLLSDTSKLNAFINSIGGTALSIGSVKVNTINLQRIAYESKGDQELYLKILRKRTKLCCKVLDVVRHIIKRNIEKGLLPNYCDGGVEMDKQYCTVGILGLFEVIEYFGLTYTDEFGYVYYTDEGIEFASKIFEVLNDVKDNFVSSILNSDGTPVEPYSFNIESVPAERAAVILCQKDNRLYEKNDKFIYSNQWVPLSAKCTIQEKLRLSSILDNKCSGGAIAHINLESNFPNTDTAWDMLKYIAKSGVIYFAFNTRINECKNHHGFVGTDICPVCGEPVFDTYQRIVGYLVPTRSYSKDRFKEFNTRRWYNYASELRDL